MTHRAPASLLTVLLKTCQRGEGDENEISEQPKPTFPNQPLAPTPLRFVGLALLLGESGDECGKTI